MFIFSEQTGQSILRKVMSLTVIFAPHELHVTVFCGAGIPGSSGNAPGAGGIGNSPGAGGIGNPCEGKGRGGSGSGGNSPLLGVADTSISSGDGISATSGNSPGRGIGGRFLERLSKISLASLSLFLFILDLNLFHFPLWSTFSSGTYGYNYMI